ncbi:MAG: patatin-like phospholipase family protein [Flavobacteriaceae bacterium]|nr:patatin-like phospholipase family protein [Flavobacteriaceae bacterium]
MADENNSSLWGDLAPRFETKQPRKILALDGGGIRGVLTLGILTKIESDLKEKLGRGDDFRLCDYFDHFGGTSTGAIIAAGLAIGMSAQDLLDFYKKYGKAMFAKSRYTLLGWFFSGFKFKSGPLTEKLKEVYGADTDMDIANGKFKSLLTVVTMNRSTDSPWPISNNPFAKYNNKERPDNNQKIKLFQLVRASTAAPSFFASETVSWDKDDPSKTFDFVDGGVTPYNNPAFLLYKMSTLPAYKLNWPTGEKDLLVVSLGTGAGTTKGRYRNLGGIIKNIPNNLMYAMQVDQDFNCRMAGRCMFGDQIDREVNDMIYSSEKEKDFLYVRYNADLSDQGLIDLGFGHLDPKKIRQMDEPDNIQDLMDIGMAAAKNQVKMEHFGSFV